MNTMCTCLTATSSQVLHGRYQLQPRYYECLFFNGIGYMRLYLKLFLDKLSPTCSFKELFTVRRNSPLTTYLTSKIDSLYTAAVPLTTRKRGGGHGPIWAAISHYCRLSGTANLPLDLDRKVDDSGSCNTVSFLRNRSITIIE